MGMQLIKPVCGWVFAGFMLTLVYDINAGNGFYNRPRGRKYEWSAGLRIGNPFAATLKHFINPAMAWEFNAGYYRYNDKGNWKQVSAALQYHIPVTTNRLLHWYGGGGLSAMYWYYAPDWGAGVFPQTTSGAFLQTGLDYRMKRWPLNLAVDWTPYLQFSGVDRGLGLSYGALSIRYIIR
jgi:hypothetical protein